MSNEKKVSLKEVFEEIKASAESGDTKTYALLASKYFEGAGTERNLVLAEEWAKKALQEDGGDQLAAQILYWISRETEDQYTDEVSESMKILNSGTFAMRQRNYGEAFKCFTKSAKMGHAVAMNNLSVCYFNGLGTKTNKVAAFEWMKKAAEGGYQSAYYPLAAKYFMGVGCAKSAENALFWATKAYEEKTQYEKEAKELLDIIKNN